MSNVWFDRTFFRMMHHHNVPYLFLQQLALFILPVDHLTIAALFLWWILCVCVCLSVCVCVEGMNAMTYVSVFTKVWVGVSIIKTSKKTNGPVLKQWRTLSNLGTMSCQHFPFSTGQCNLFLDCTFEVSCRKQITESTCSLSHCALWHTLWLQDGLIW